MTEDLKLEEVISDNVRELKIQTLLLANSVLNDKCEQLIEQSEKREEYIRLLETELKGFKERMVH